MLRTPPAARPSRPATPVRVRRFIERLGPTFVNVALYLAGRPDIIGTELAAEFSRLADTVPPVPFDLLRGQISRDLGAAPESFFSWIDPRAHFSRAFHQTHRARTLKGEQVAIKILRPDIASTIDRDLQRSRVMNRILQITGASMEVSAEEVLRQASRWIHTQLDLGLELRNLNALYHSAGDNEYCRIARPFPGLSGQHVLTVEFFAGVPLSEVMSMPVPGQSERFGFLRMDRERLVKNLMLAILDQVFGQEFFVANVHPANLIVLGGELVSYMDFSIADTLDPQFRQGLMRYLAALSAEDTERMFDGLTELLVANERSDLNELRTDFQEATARWQRERKAREPGAGSPTARYLAAIFRSARINHFRVPATIESLYRTLVTAETLAGELGSNQALGAVARPVLRRLQLRSLVSALGPDNLQPVVLDGIGLISDGPRNLRRLLTDLVEGRLVLRVRTIDSIEDRRQANARARLIALSTASVGVAFLLGASRGRVLFHVVPLSWLLAGLLVVVWGWIALQWKDMQ